MEEVPQEALARGHLGGKAPNSNPEGKTVPTAFVQSCRHGLESPQFSDSPTLGLTTQGQDVC